MPREPWVSANLLIGPDTRGPFAAKVAAEHEERRALHAGKSVKQPALSITAARANRRRIDWTAQVPVAPLRPGIQVFEDYPLAKLLDYIDWMPFFNAWEFAGNSRRVDRPGGR
jgi:5-methyltetrahydrofolate--homocysteine methyltransferase